MSKVRGEGVPGSEGLASPDAGVQAELAAVRDLPEAGARPAPLSEERMRALGMSDVEIRQALCEHDFGTTCYGSFMGCYRRCEKCGSMIGLGRHCAGSGYNADKETR